MAARSKAEDILAAALLPHLDGYGVAMNYPIPLLVTYPDFVIRHPQWEQPLLIYLDGEKTPGKIHASEVQEAKDDEIDSWLERRRILYLRIPYKPPITKRVLKTIVSQIIAAVETQGAPM